MEDKLRFHTDSWDLSVDLKAGLAGIVIIDARSHDAYAAGHIPGAISFPHREMSIETTTKLDRGIVYVVYCDGIGCNASTKGAYKLARQPSTHAPSFARSQRDRLAGVQTRRTEHRKDQPGNPGISSYPVSNLIVDPLNASPTGSVLPPR